MHKSQVIIWNSGMEEKERKIMNSMKLQVLEELYAGWPILQYLSKNSTKYRLRYTLFAI